MSMMLIFNRKVIPTPTALDKSLAKVETTISGFVDGEPFEVGFVKFPTKQSWTKFWGAVQRGAMSVPDLEVKMLNVPLEEEAPPTDEQVTKFVGAQSENPQKP